MDTVTHALTGPCTLARASLVAQRAESLPAMQETWVPCLGQEDALEEEMATLSRSLALENSITAIREVGGRTSE